MKYSYCILIISQIIISTTSNAMFDSWEFSAPGKNFITRFTNNEGFDVFEKPFCWAGKKGDKGNMQYFGVKMVSDNPCPDYLERKELNSKQAQELWETLKKEYALFSTYQLIENTVAHGYED